MMKGHAARYRAKPCAKGGRNGAYLRNWNASEKLSATLIVSDKKKTKIGIHVGKRLRSRDANIAPLLDKILVMMHSPQDNKELRPLR